MKKHFSHPLFYSRYIHQNSSPALPSSLPWHPTQHPQMFDEHLALAQSLSLVHHRGNLTARQPPGVACVALALHACPPQNSLCKSRGHFAQRSRVCELSSSNKRPPVHAGMGGSLTSPALLLRLAILGQDPGGCIRAERQSRNGSLHSMESPQCSTQLVANVSTPDIVHL